MAPSSKSVIPEQLKQTVTQQANQLIETKFALAMAINAESAEKHGFNYVVDIYTTWRGRHFYFCAKYRNPRPDAKEEYFEVRTTRMEYLGGDRFSLAYMRHTGKWCEVFPALAVDECLEMVESNELFWPLH
ncbi:MAG: hypothetical protein U9N82_07550 [Thermodesulfobacteriota bacterium]|nr:hypothetical protein [Thermodesulfobacteriota bacterium]